MAFALRARTNADEVFAKLDAWTADVVNIAAPRAVNRLADQARTAGLREISNVYRIGPRTFEKYVEVRLAQSGELVATLTCKGSGLPLYLFQPRQVRGKGGGVSVAIKGRRVLIPHAFIESQKGKPIKFKSGHRGVFARGAYGGKGKNVFTGETSGRFHFGRERYSVNELFTFSPPGAFSNPRVTDAMNDRVLEQADKVFAQEVRFASR